jgi:hypothetical protein
VNKVLEDMNEVIELGQKWNWEDKDGILVLDVRVPDNERDQIGNIDDEQKAWLLNFRLMLGGSHLELPINPLTMDFGVA